MGLPNIPLVNYHLLSNKEISLFLPADGFIKIKNCLNGKTDRALLEESPSLNRFEVQVEAISTAAKNAGDSYEGVARALGCEQLVDYLILRTCERGLQPRVYQASGEELQNLGGVYFPICESADKLENPAITQAIRFTSKIL